MAELDLAAKGPCFSGRATIDTDAFSGFLLMRAGRYREAAVLFQRGRSLSEKYDDRWSIAFFEFLPALALFERGNLPATVEAVKRVDQLTDRVTAAGRGRHGTCSRIS